ncbi:MAG: hypothetical protein WCF33_05670 [Pseudonocardiaceae bacterium]
MPTGRPRHTLTETDEITAALADATARWPGLPPTELLKRLIAEGHAALRISLDTERTAVADTSGALTGTYQAGDLDTLRQDWPA